MLEEKSIYLVFEYAEHDFLVSAAISTQLTDKGSSRPSCGKP